MLPSQGSDPGSSPGGRIFVLSFEGVKVKSVSIRAFMVHSVSRSLRKWIRVQCVVIRESCLLVCIVGEGEGLKSKVVNSSHSSVGRA